ncbi:cation:proton antiporter domain-containing protein [Aureliella helgolandensis]|uniref:Putative voltage-gated ClC-type chloride channel ClcB n=1 Tax=Aureliella helgolandensis TaxID=2527968 RepID=A0A518GHL4_9BACT|nr:cation:proton antiporter [Aureliella helgolandensis]QDV28074.1 putative voltage-gated ClC-type chloride channel ClcB [Aureliella helgolandensis]
MPDALPFELHSAVAFGLLLLAALLGGIVADLLRVPKVTAYLLAGVLVGPSIAHWITTDQLHHFAPLTKLAMALVLLELGYQFPLAHLRPILRHALWLSLGELVTTFVLVTSAVLLFDGGWAMAVLLGALALATAPATTVLVFKESNSEGPVTELAGVLVAFNNIAAIIGFEVLFITAQMMSGDFEGPALPVFGRLLADLGGATLMGLLAGLTISYGSGLLNRRRWLVMILAVAILLLGLCETWHLPYMLTFLVAGMVIVNTSESTGPLLLEQEKIAGLLVVVFFTVHGAELDLAAFLSAGLLGVVYIVARSAGKIFGLRWAAHLRGEAATVRRYLGSCMLAQAGAAIALALVAAERWPAVGTQIQVIILGSVVFFEIVGPICIRWAVLKAGEVPLAQAISHRTESASSQAGKMWHHGREALGLKQKQPPNVQNMVVRDLLRAGVTGLKQTANFDQVVNYIQRSHDNTYMVVNSQQQMVGVIRYNQLSDTFFDSSIDNLVRAEDLTSPIDLAVYPDEPLSRAAEVFRSSSDDVLPVISRDEPSRLLGVIRRGDLTSLAVRFRPAN